MSPRIDRAPSPARTPATRNPLIGIEHLGEPAGETGRVLVQIGRRPLAPDHAPLPDRADLVRLSLDDFAGEPGPTTGRQPLPEHGQLVATLEAAGITPSTRLVVFAESEKDLGAAARAWVTLRWAGARDVRFLNGAFANGVARVLEELPIAPVPARPGSERFQIDAAATIEAEVIVATPPAHLVDARPSEAFSAVDEQGRTEHIAGAVNLPSSSVSAGGAILPAEQVHAAYEALLGTDPAGRDIVLSCGSGISASVQALALASIGVPAPVYIGSWSEWSKRPER